MKRRNFIQNTSSAAMAGILTPNIVPSTVLSNDASGKFQEEITKNRNDFVIEALSDFPDDALDAPEPIGAAHIDAMMQRLAECGVRRVSWGYYGDGRGGFLTPSHDPKYENLA